MAGELKAKQLAATLSADAAGRAVMASGYFDAATALDKIAAGAIVSGHLGQGAGVAALLAAGLGGSHSSIKTEAATTTVVAAHGTKDRACIVVVTIDETYATGDTTAPTLKVGEDDTIEKAFAAATIANKTAGTVLVAAFTNLATKKIIVTTTAKAGTGTGGATVTVLAIPTT